ncbi:MAG: PEP-CTERM sorting domain-containing protein [Phycisphaeraceae bacterium]|nr:PEP-CTERM sorting domain-containing protein [Phycisphaeraceae bacterium]
MKRLTNRQIRRIHPGIAAALLLLGTTPVASAQNYSWASAVAGDWSEESNWTPAGGPPGPGDTAIFNIAGSYTVRIPGATGPGITTSQMGILQGNVTLRPLLNTNYGLLDLTFTGLAFEVDGLSTTASLGVNTRPLDLNVAGITRVTNGELRINWGSTLTTDRLQLATALSSSSGTVVVGAEGSAVSTFNVQGSIQTHFLAQNGASATLTVGPTGVANIAGSLWVGRSSVAGTFGNLQVQDGGVANLNNLLIGGGSSPTASGAVSVQGVLQVDGTTSIGGLAAASSTSGLEVQSGGQWVTGTGATTLGAASFLNLMGNLELRGDLTIQSGGNMEIISAGSPAPSVSVADGVTVRIEQGASFYSQSTTPATALLTAGSGGLVEILGQPDLFSVPVTPFGGTAVGTKVNITDDATFTIQGGANVTVGNINVLTTVSTQVEPGTITRTINVLDGARINSVNMNLQSMGGTERPIHINLDDGTIRLSGNNPVRLGLDGGGGSPTVVTISGGGELSNFTDNPDSQGLLVNEQGSIAFADGGGSVSFSDIIVRGGSIVAPSGVRGFAGLFPSSDAEHQQKYHILEGGTVELRNDLIFIDRTEFLVDGPGSSFLISDDASINHWGALWMTAFPGSAESSVTVRNEATMRVQQFNLATTTFSAEPVYVNVESGGTLSVGNLGVGSLVLEYKDTDFLDVSFAQAAELRVDGPGSRLVVEPGPWLGVVHIGQPTSWEPGLTDVHVRLTDRGEFDTRQGTTFIHAGATIHVEGGHLNLGAYEMLGGQVLFNSGKVSTGQEMALATGELLGPTVILNAQRELVVHDDLHISPIGLLQLSGGSLTAEHINILPGGSFAFSAGHLKLTGSGGVSIGGPGPLSGSALVLDADKTLEVVHTAQVLAGVVVEIKNSGRLDAGTLNNAGVIVMDGPAARIATGVATFNNSGRLSGTGIIEGPFVNLAGGEVRGEAGHTLTFTAPAPSNSGDIRLFDGFIDFAGDLTNTTGGRILGRGVLNAASLNNAGQMQLSAGFSDIFAPMDNLTGSKVIISGGATASFYEEFEVQSAAELRVSAGATAVFFDHVQLRTGAQVTGTGTIHYEGSLGIGDSPSRQVFSTNTTLGSSSHLIAQFGGPDEIVPHYDQFVFENDLAMFGGSLALELISPDGVAPIYEPEYGHQFRMIETGGTMTGKFGEIEGVLLSPTKALAVTYTDEEVLVTVALPGDTDIDGTVDDLDLAALQASLGTWSGATWADGDFHGDGRVGLRDAFLLVGNYGSSVGGSTSIPEPGSLSLLGAGAMLLAGRRRR